jgi:hypothetical protein
MPAHTIISPRPWRTVQNADISKPTWCHTHCLPSAWCSWNWDSSMKRTLLQCASDHQRWALAYWSGLRRPTAVRLRPCWGWRASRWASLRRFLTVLAEILWLCKPTVSSAGLRRSHRGRSWMWRSWAVMVTHGLRMWGRLDVVPNSLKQHWRLLMLEKWTLHSLATALVDIPAVGMPIARSIKNWDIFGIVLCDKTVYFRVALYCSQHKVHLCNDHAV